MNNGLLMGIDIGTGGCKVAVYNIDGKLVKECFKEYSIIHPRIDWAEQNPMDWWNATIECIRNILKNIDPNNILSISLTSQREAFVPIDRKNNILYNSIIWLDKRTINLINKVKKKFSLDEILDITGVPIDYIYTLSKLLWLKYVKPNIFKKIFKIIFPKDFITYMLSGEIVTDYSMASRTMMFNINRLKWSEKICNEFDIPLSILPELRGSWEIVGEVSREASKKTGLRKGIPIVAGGGDRPCEALGSGTISEGEINIGTGTGTDFEAPLSNPRPDKMGRVSTCVHVVPDTWEYEVIINATGGSLRWFRDNFCYEEVRESRIKNLSIYDLILRKAEKVPIGSENLFYYPYLWGARAPKFNPRAKGVFIGFTYAHTKSHFIRSILEGIGFQYIETLKLYESLGINISRITMTGGEVRSSLWNSIKANIIGMNINIPKIIDAACLGAAILASIGVGIFSSFKDAVKSMVHIAETYVPDPEIRLKYAKIYRKYNKIYRVFEEVFNLL